MNIGVNDFVRSVTTGIQPALQPSHLRRTTPHAGQTTNHTASLSQKGPQVMVKNILVKLANDEAGFIVSAELVLVATIAILAMVVGLSEVAHNINNELEDVGSAFGNMTQTYQYYGSSGHKGSTEGSCFYDNPDYCDNDCDIVSTTPTGEN